MGNKRTKVIIACVLGILAGFFGDIGRVTAPDQTGAAAGHHDVMPTVRSLNITPTPLRLSYKKCCGFFSRGCAQIHADTRKKPCDNVMSTIRVYL